MRANQGRYSAGRASRDLDLQIRDERRPCGHGDDSAMVTHATTAVSKGGFHRPCVTDLFRRTLDSLLSHMAILRADGTIIAVNAPWNAFATGNGLKESLCGPGVNYLDVCESAYGDCAEQARQTARGIRDVARGRTPDFQLEYPCHSPTEHRWYIVRVTRFVVGPEIFVVVTHDNITKRKLAEQELQEANRLLEAQAATDGLTGVANRRHFDRVLALEWRRHARSGSSLSLLLIDVDHFKKPNDAHGHLAGDDCLREVARTLQASVRRPADLVARYGGEEFAVVLPVTDGPGALVMADMVRERLRLRGLPHGAPGAGPLVTLSIGCTSLVPTGGDVAGGLIKRADRALYEAKAAGRDGARYAD
jgi:diguanylate cyclase (GGDEF)-like protein